jgi:hypothetical protein
MPDSHDREGRALQRILSTPHLARAVPRVPAELLHRVIQHHGLEDCAELVALATPEQLTRVFDLDLWQPPKPGLDERFDASRFGVWLHVLLESGADAAARRVAAMAPALVVTGLARHVRVFDVASVMPYTTLDGEQTLGRGDDAIHCDIAGYRVVARRDDAWDAVVEVLLALERAHPDSFQTLMTRCRALSNSAPEESGMHALLDDPEQAMFDLAFDRERRREQHGYATPAQARAFLDRSRRFDERPSDVHDPIAAAYFRALDAQARESQPERAALTAGAGDHLHAIEAEQAVAAVVEVLLDSGILEPAQRALPGGTSEDAPRLGRIHAAMRIVLDRDADRYARRSGELGYLANTLLSGCSMQARAFTPQEASDAAVAICNLGLESWTGAPPDDVLIAHDLIAVFRRGWSVLYERVSLPAARALLEALARVRTRDRETQIGVNRLRAELARQLEAGAPWAARGSLDVIATLDLPAWAALLGLLDECPVMHAVIAESKPLSVSPTAFDFIAQTSQLDAIDRFLATLDQAFLPT